MYAVIETGGKQYRVTEGQVLTIEKLEADAQSNVTFDRILMLTDGDKMQVGVPYLAGATVTARVLKQGRLPKIEIIKLKRRKHHIKHQGHRQYFTQVIITGIAA